MKKQFNNKYPKKIRRKKRHFEKPSMAFIVLMSLSGYMEVILNIPTSIADRILYLNTIHSKVSASAWFPTPEPTMAAFNTTIDDFDTAVKNVKKKVPGAVTIQKTTWNLAHLSLKTLQLYVQIICNNNLAHAKEIAEDAGMAVKAPSIYNVQNFTIKVIKGGKVKMTAISPKQKNSNDWQCSLDLEDPMGWYYKIIDSTLQLKRTSEGFTPGTLVHFRHRYILKGGATAWSDIISVYII